MDWGELVIDADGPSRRDLCVLWIAGEQVLRRKAVWIKVLWKHRGVEEATWEHKDTMRTRYPFLFQDEGTWISH